MQNDWVLHAVGRYEGKGWLKISGEGGIEIGAKGFETLFCLACSVSIVFTSRGESDQKRSTIYRHYIN